MGCWSPPGARRPARERILHLIADVRDRGSES
jgi:hypothetical protein